MAQIRWPYVVENFWYFVEVLSRLHYGIDPTPDLIGCLES